MSAVLLVSGDFLKSHVGAYVKKDGTAVSGYTNKVVKKISDRLGPYERAVVAQAEKAGFTVKEDSNFMRVFRVTKDEHGRTELTGLVIYPSGKVTRLPDGAEVKPGANWRAILGLPAPGSDKLKAKAEKSANAAPKSGHGASGAPGKVVAPQYGFGGFSGGLFGFGGAGKDWKNQTPKAYHPKLNDEGKQVGIYAPSKSNLEGFADPAALVTITPGDTIPGELNGIALEPWTPPETWEGWADVPGQLPMDEPPLQLVGEKEAASGVIIVEPDGRFWAVSPTNGFGGYRHTFTKGKNEDDLPLQANAIKEAYEESGLKVEIVAMIGDVERTTSVTRYYLARRVAGSPAAVGWESQAVHLVPAEKLGKFLDAKADRDVINKLAGLGEPGDG